MISSASGSRPVPLSVPVSRPGRGFQHHRTAAAQRGHVVDGGRVQPHLGVHRRREQHRTSGREQRRGQQIVGPAGYRPGQQVGGGRRHHDQVGLLAELNMRHLGNVVEDAGVDRLTGQRLKGGGPDEAQRGFGGDDADLMTGLGELTDDGARLVGGDASGDADDDPFAILLRSAQRPACPVTRPRCVRAGRRGSRATRSTAAFPAARARPADQRTRGCPHRAGCSSR